MSFSGTAAYLGVERQQAEAESEGERCGAQSGHHPGAAPVPGVRVARQAGRCEWLAEWQVRRPPYGERGCGVRPPDEISDLRAPGGHRAAREDTGRNRAGKSGERIGSSRAVSRCPAQRRAAERGEQAARIAGVIAVGAGHAFSGLWHRWPLPSRCDGVAVRSVGEWWYPTLSHTTGSPSGVIFCSS